MRLLLLLLIPVDVFATVYALVRVADWTLSLDSDALGAACLFATAFILLPIGIGLAAFILEYAMKRAESRKGKP